MAVGWRRWLRRGRTERMNAPEAYALWAPSYPAEPHNPLMMAEQRLVAPLLESLRPRRALDLGTGSGRYLRILKAAGAPVVVGLDLSLAMLLRGSNSTRVCGDACRLPFGDRCFDLVSASLMVGDVPDIAAWIAEAARVLAPGGSLVYSDFHPSWAAAGWRRTFKAADGREIELPYHSHAMSDHLDGLAHAGLKLRTLQEPVIPERTSPVLALVHAFKPERPLAGEPGDSGPASR